VPAVAPEEAPPLLGSPLPNSPLVDPAVSPLEEPPLVPLVDPALVEPPLDEPALALPVDPVEPLLEPLLPELLPEPPLVLVLAACTVSVSCCVALLPAASVATACTQYTPSTSAGEGVVAKLPLPSGAVAPLSKATVQVTRSAQVCPACRVQYFTSTLGESVSIAVPLTVLVAWVTAGAPLSVSTGAVVSIVKVCVCVAVLPAASVADSSTQKVPDALGAAVAVQLPLAGVLLGSKAKEPIAVHDDVQSAAHTLTVG
jgi:hypothetical protein